MDSYIDLHVHSSCSDGTFTPEELVCYAQKKGLRAFALTDHDTVAGIQRAVDAAAGTELTVIPGVELSSDYKSRDIHILVLGIDRDSRKYSDYLDSFREARGKRNRLMIQKLQEHGVRITEEDMDRVFPECVWTRAHFARFLKDRGFASSMEDAFRRYVGDEAPCFVPKEQPAPEEAVKLILDCGGHPCLLYTSDAADD